MSPISRSNFLSRKRVGVLLRVFASREEYISNRIEMVKKTVERVKSVTVDGQTLIKNFNVLVWADQRFKEEADCGKTASELRNQFHDDPDVQIHEVRHGDLFCGILNYGIATQLRNRIDYSIVVSSEAFNYINSETLTGMVDAVCDGARAIGVAINELTELVMEGRIANTFAMWHNVSLVTAGGFDYRSAKPQDERLAHYIRGWHPDKGDVFYHLAGVEEVIPLSRLVELFGPCIAPILPQGEGVQQYQVPDPALERDLWERHVAKFGTKIERQIALLASIGYDLSFLKGGVMPKYRCF